MHILSWVFATWDGILYSLTTMMDGLLYNQSFLNSENRLLLQLLQCNRANTKRKSKYIRPKAKIHELPTAGIADKQRNSSEGWDWH